MFAPMPDFLDTKKSWKHFVRIQAKLEMPQAQATMTYAHCHSTYLVRRMAAWTPHHNWKT